MRLGFAVKVLGGGGLPSHDTRRWQSEPHLRGSLEARRPIWGYLDDHDIRMYRMTASLAPYVTHPEIGLDPHFQNQVEACATELADLGRAAAEQGLRLSTHPGQYIVLNSEDPDVQAGAIRDPHLQGELFDAMGPPPESGGVLHLGGTGGGRDAALDRFEAGFARLSEAAQRRLVIENDDRTFALCDVLELSRRIGRPVVWDILHHHCNDPERIGDREALELALATWPDGVTPKIHYSTPKTSLEERKKRVGRRVERSWVLPQLRAHADMIDPIGFEHFIRETVAGHDFDVMLEAKAKDLALLRLREHLAARQLDVEGHNLDATTTGLPSP